MAMASTESFSLLAVSKTRRCHCTVSPASFVHGDLHSQASSKHRNLCHGYVANCLIAVPNRVASHHTTNLPLVDVSARVPAAVQTFHQPTNERTNKPTEKTNLPRYVSRYVCSLVRTWTGSGRTLTLQDPHFFDTLALFK